MQSSLQGKGAILSTSNGRCTVVHVLVSAGKHQLRLWGQTWCWLSSVPQNTSVLRFKRHNGGESCCVTFCYDDVAHPSAATHLPHLETSPAQLAWRGSDPPCRSAGVT